MNKAILSFLIVLAAFGAFGQSTAKNFVLNDCDGNSHNLFSELESGNVVVLVWVMPCGNCINKATTAYNIVQSYSVSNPGKIKYYLCDDAGNTSCATLKNWASTNGLDNVTAFSNSAIKMTDYGTPGMPKLVILSGGKSHQVYFNQDYNFSATDFSNAMTTALAASAGPQYSIQPSRTVTFTADMSNITINDIFQPNTSNSKIILKWELVSINLPSSWQYSMCDYQTCHTGIPQGPTVMDTIPVGGKGLLGLNIDPGTESGSGVVKVIVYQDGFKGGADTLTWYVNAGTVGIKEMAIGKQLLIYPNPTSQKANFYLTNASGATGWLLDASGREISRLELVNGLNTIDLSNLSKGVYTIRIAKPGDSFVTGILKE